MNLPPLHTLPDWDGFRRVAIDIETKDPGLTDLGPGVRRGNGFITGIAFACDDGTPVGPAAYLPMRHQGGGNYENPDAVLGYFRHQAKHFGGEIVGANLQYDLDWLAEDGVKFTPRFFRDVQVSGPLLDQPTMCKVQNKATGGWFYGDEFHSMSLQAQAERAGLPGKDDSELVAWAKDHGLDPKADMWMAPASRVSKYAVQDVRLPLELIERHEREIDEQELWDVYNLESRLLLVLLKMRRRGVRVDTSKLGMIRAKAQALEIEAMKEVSRLSGRQVDISDTSKSESLALCLEKVGIEVPLTEVRISEKTGKETGGSKSVTAPWLRSLRIPLADAILEARRWNKIGNDFCKSILDHEVNGRIHATFNQLRQERETGEMKGAAFGRLSCSDPNLQQQPSRDPEIGPMWRSIYLPDEGGEWACLDFSSQEPRLITHYAELTGCDGGAEAANACRTDANWDNHSMMASMMYDEFSVEALNGGCKIMKGLRGNAKTIFLGLCYGMGGGKLCLSLGLEAIQVVKDPNVREWRTVLADSDEGRELQKQGQRPFLMAGEEGQALLNRFRMRVPYVGQLQRMAKAKANRVGYIKTLLGRRCRFPRHPQTGRLEWAHKALNRLIQGSAADQTKMAMVLADEAGVRMQLQVHDEIDLTIWDRKEAEVLNEIMVDAIKLNVPTRCDIETGPDWGSIS